MHDKIGELGKEVTTIQEQIEKLRELSTIDTKIAAIQNSLLEIPNELEELDSRFSTAASRLEEKKLRLGTAQQEKTAKEQAQKEEAERIVQREARLYEIKTNKEYQAALKEIAESKKTNKDIEDVILNLMTEAETLTKEIQDLEGQVTAQREEIEKKTSSLQEKKKELEGELTQDEKKRTELALHIEKKVLEKYIRVRRMQSDAVAFLEGRSCLGCYMQVPPQLVIEVQKNNDLHLCPNCHRILFMKPRKEQEN